MGHSRQPRGRFGDLLPLPLDPLPEPSLSFTRSSRRRGQRSRADTVQVNETISAVNSLAGFPADTWPEAPRNAAQRSSIRRIRAIIRGRSWPSGSPCKPRAALSQLLREGPLYGSDEHVGSLASYTAGRVSLPSDQAVACALSDVLPMSLGEDVAEFSSRLLVSDDVLGKIFEEGEPPMYHDPLLADDPFAYAQFLSELHRAKIIAFSRRTPICINGIFFVLKKG